MRTNYVLIDYENVQPDSLNGLDADHYKVLLFVGASQGKLTFEVAEAMQRLGARAQYVKIAGNGSNALDFHIAFYVGEVEGTTNYRQEDDRMSDTQFFLQGAQPWN